MVPGISHGNAEMGIVMPLLLLLTYYRLLVLASSRHSIEQRRLVLGDPLLTILAKKFSVSGCMFLEVDTP